MHMGGGGVFPTKRAVIRSSDIEISIPYKDRPFKIAMRVRAVRKKKVEPVR